MTPSVEELEAEKKHLDAMLVETEGWDDLTPEEEAFVNAPEDETEDDSDE